MNFDGSVIIKSKRDTVWEFLTDPHLGSQCAPGVKEVEVVIPDKQFRTNVGIALGALAIGLTAGGAAPVVAGLSSLGSGAAGMGASGAAAKKGQIDQYLAASPNPTGSSRSS